MNNLKRKEYDKAIKQINEALPIFAKYKDYYTATEASTALGECYLMKHNFIKTKEAICGFGDTPIEAIRNFTNSLRLKLFMFL